MRPMVAYHRGGHVLIKTIRRALLAANTLTRELDGMLIDRQELLDKYDKMKEQRDQASENWKKMRDDYHRLDREHEALKREVKK